MQAVPGGNISGEAIIGREKEISDIWRTLEKQSVILTAERRVGKTCILRKMGEQPRNKWTPLTCSVEQCSHPIECVEKIYDQASLMEVQSTKGAWLKRIRSGYKKIAGTEVAGWKIPSITACRKARSPLRTLRAMSSSTSLRWTCETRPTAALATSTGSAAWDTDSRASRKNKHEPASNAGIARRAD